MKTHILGYPRIGSKRELKKACEKYWAGKISLNELKKIAGELRSENRKLQQEMGIDLLPSNDFSFYDQVLDMSFTLGVIPKRFQPLILNDDISKLDLYFAMARGHQKNDLDITAMEMTKWFDTNYHYIVPEFEKDQSFNLFSDKIISEFNEAKEEGFITKPVLIGPLTYLLLGKETDDGFDRLDLLENLLPVYIDLLKELKNNGAEWVQIDEPFLALDINDKTKQLYLEAYKHINHYAPDLKILITTYFEGISSNLNLVKSLPIHAIHLDLIRDTDQLTSVLENFPDHMALSLGIVDGRNIWKNDFNKSLSIIKEALTKINADRLFIAPSCSLLHVPYDLELEDKEDILFPEIKNWMSFARQKLFELNALKKIALNGNSEESVLWLKENQTVIKTRQVSTLIHNRQIKDRVSNIRESDTKRDSDFSSRKVIQQDKLNLPLFPTTTIGSFPQTDEIRKLRVQLKSGKITQDQYNSKIEQETIKAIRWQEELGIDVLAHGEFERNDMVEYFGELLEGFTFTQNGWVQSYGSRCVKPPIIYGDITRKQELTVKWSKFAQNNTSKLMKGMLTGPVTILQWSFVRDDQSRKDTCFQIALAIRDEVVDLEKAGIRIIQIDEPALREGLPLKRNNWKDYLDWSINAFRLSSSGVKDETQIHTHMCYSEFNDIIKSIAALDADVITIETSRSKMELLDAFVDFKYPNDIGPGVYDIHSPRIPTVNEMTALLEKAIKLLPAENIWVNPDCGLKTRNWPETEESLKNMVAAAKQLRATVINTA